MADTMSWKKMMMVPCVLLLISQVASYPTTGRAGLAVIPNRYIVRFQDRAVAASFQASSSFTQDGSMVNTLTPAEGFSEFKTLFHGVVVNLEDAGEVERLKGLKEVKSVFPVMQVPRPSFKTYWTQQEGDEPPFATSPRSALLSTVSSHRLGKRDVHSNNFTDVNRILGKPNAFRGFGMRVCVIDTGVDYMHPALGGCFGFFWIRFCGDAYNPGSRNISSLIPRPKNDPMDCSGHGTHVAGIIASDDVEKRGAEGVAPDATIGAYKIFGCEGNTDTATIISAIERAVNDGCDILNLSLGGGAAWYDTADSELVDTLAERGIVMVASAGNEQELGLFRINSPAVAKRAIAVGAVEKLANDTTPRAIPFVFPAGSPPNTLTSGLLKASEPLNTTIPNDGCSSYPESFFEGHIALIRRGTCLFATKIRNAFNAKASGVIIYNRLATALGEVPNPIANFTALTVSGVDGEYLMKRLGDLGNGKVGVRFEREMTVFEVQGAMLPTDFSSWGLNNDLSVKPDVVAPGGHIFSTWPLKLGGYAVLSGTSMSAPFIAGLYALVLSESTYFLPGTVNTTLLKQAFQTTSTPKPLFNTTSLKTTDFLAPPALQGSGLINITALLNATTFIQPSTISYTVSAWSESGRAENKKFSVSLWNAHMSTSKKYRVSFEEAAVVAMDDPSSPKVFPPTQQTIVMVSQDHFEIEPNGTFALTVEIEGPPRSTMRNISSTISSWMFSGYIFIKEECETDKSNDRSLLTFTISVAGVVGDFGGITSLDVEKNVPFLSRTGSGQLAPSTNPTPPRVRVTLASSLDMLAINVHMTLPSPQTIAVVFPSTVPEATARTQVAGIFGNVMNGTEVVMGGAIAVSPKVRLPLNDADNANNALYTALTWDGSRDFLGNGTVAGVGVYRVFVASGTVYSPFGEVSVWVSPEFEVI
ncbi:peptidase S8/S53 domain-containing protein [Chytridium lagenaria]|nr:peptidase S8/S53 domain-containing protein [Chytridium lagenaria]